MKSTESLVDFQKVNVVIGGKKILKDLTFSINREEIVSLIGLNGAGKTTLLKAILGIVPVQGHRKIHTKKIAYVPQKLDFDKSIPVTVSEFLEIYSGKNLTQIRKTLKKVQSTKLLKKLIGNLSGGELQKVLIANALLLEPEILLLDEPTAGIDVTGQHHFYDLIEELQKELKIAIILVSHDIHTVFAKSTKVICINGHICCQGTPKSVSESPEFNELFCHHLAPYHHHHDHNHK